MPFIFVTTLSLFGCQDKVDWFGPYDEPDVNGYPQYRLDALHQGLANDNSNFDADFTVAWQSEALAVGDYSASKSSPIIEGDDLYIGVDDGHLYSISTIDGSVQWKFLTSRGEIQQEKSDATATGIHGTAAADEDNVYIGDYDGWLYSLNRTNGEAVWSVKLGGSIGASPVWFRDHIFMAVEYPDPDGKIFVVDAKDGSVYYETPFLGQHPHSSVSIDPKRGYMFVGVNSGKFYCYDFVEKEEVWVKDFGSGGDIKSTAAVVGDIVYITSWDKKLHAINIVSGKELFTVETEGKSMSSPSYYNGKIYFGSHDGHLYCADAEDGTLLWSYDTNHSITSSPTIVPNSNAVVVGSYDGTVYMLDLESGEELSQITTNGTISSVPAIVDDSMYLYDFTGVVWRID